jgi:chaperone modulatory protein CbpM
MSDRISREELVRIYNIEIAFFDALQESGLLKTETENEVKYLLYDELEIFERFANWHYDLDVNLPGVEVIHHLLQKMERLREENRKLINQLSNENI